MLDRKFLFFVVGATNVGKSTFLKSVAEAHPHGVHLVEVGKWMRAKYPPEHFQGQGAPAHTQAEALNMLFASVLEGDRKGARFILVDGQPRNPEQARAIMNWKELWGRERAVIELVCPRKERERRLWERFDQMDPAYALGEARLDRDVLDIHEVLLEFTRYDIHRFNTARSSYTPLAAFQSVLRSYRQAVDLRGGTDAENPL